MTTTTTTTTAATQPFSGTYAVDAAHSTLGFAVRHMNVSLFRATFGNLEGRLEHDGGTTKLSGTAAVESISIQDPPEFRQHVVYNADFFDAHNHPAITATADGIRFGDDGTVDVEGELTIRGITKPVSATGTYRAPLEDPFGGRRAALELTATVDRRDWGLDWQTPLPNGDDALDYTVELTASIELVEEG